MKEQPSHQPMRHSTMWVAAYCHDISSMAN